MTPNDGRDDGRRVDPDQVFSALGETCRRRILTALEEDNPRWTYEFETDEFRPEGMDPETIAVELHHFHLPKLVDAGFVEWDRDSGKIVRGGAFEDVQPYLDFLDDESDLPAEWVLE